MGRYRSIIVHSMCLLLDGYYMQRSQFVFGALRDNGWKSFAGEYAFLTQITHTLQTLLFALLLVFDLFHLFIGGDRQRKKQQRSGASQPREPKSLYYINLLGDHGFSVLTVFTSVVGNYSIRLVCKLVVHLAFIHSGVFFWGIYFYDRDLIFPKSAEHFYPRDVNLFQHGIVMFIMLAELLTTHHRNLFSPLYEILVVLGAGSVYLVWTLFLVQVNGVWPYPFQNGMSMADHAIFYAVSMVFMIAMVMLKRALVYLWWGAAQQAVLRREGSKDAVKRRHKVE